jgi:formylglycine-generating enzyme required for sulfatase activity
MPNRAAAIASFSCHEEATWNKSETLPINCVSWRLAFAFCAWDGGRLPTEAEWELAAAGKDENRLYPWGNEAPGSDLVSYLHSGNEPAEVGSFPTGNGRWGHRDLAGNVGEWVLDLYDAEWYDDGCAGCANLEIGFERVVRGGNWWSGIVGDPTKANDLRAASRWYMNPSGNGGGSGIGFRCAR